MDSRTRFVLSLIAAAAALTAGAAAARAQCLASTAKWQSLPLAARSAPFTAVFDVVPEGDRIDAATGLGQGAAKDYASLSVAVRFNNSGFIDARDDGAYAAVSRVPYVAGAKYRFRVDVNPAARSYSVYVTPPGSPELTLASNYAFRAGEAPVSSLNTWSFKADAGGEQVCDFALVSAAAAPPGAAPPTVSLTYPASGAALSGAVAPSATASGGVVGVQFMLDSTALGAEVPKAPFTTAWNTASSLNGSHTLTAIARDAAGVRTTSAPVMVIVSNAPPASPACLTSNSAAWQNAALAPQVAPFTASFDATPASAKMDGATGLSEGGASGWPSLAVAVRFNNSGLIDARDGSAYAAAAKIPYTPGAQYHFRLTVDPAARSYSAWVTPPGAAERPLARNYSFRAERSSTSVLNNWALFADAGSHRVCAFTLSAATPPAPDLIPPTVALTAPAAGASLSGAASVSAAAADNVAVAGVQFRLDGANLGLELTAPPYTAIWNTASSANGAHVLTAVARDAAGNKTTSEAVRVLIHNAAPPPGSDRFGIKEIYRTAPGGKVWTSTWDNGVPRTFGYAADPSDPWFDAAHGDAAFAVDGKGLLSITGAAPRMYVRAPALAGGMSSGQQWRDVELTVYAMRVADGGAPSGGIEGVARTNHGTFPAGIADQTNPCDTRGLGARFRYDGHIDFEKVTSYPRSVALNNKPMWSAFPYGSWIGYKLIVYDLANGDVKLENYMDLTNGVDGGTWTLVNSLVDTGKNFGVGGVPCAPGIDPALKLGDGDARPGSESGRPNAAVYWKSDNVGPNGLIYKWMSVREISAF